jgi:hypothetical protein
VLLDENACSLCSSQIRDVASQLWFSRRLVGSCVWPYKPVEWLTEEELSQPESGRWNCGGGNQEDEGEQARGMAEITI